MTSVQRDDDESSKEKLSFKHHPRWCPHTRKEKVLCAFFLFFLILAAALLTALVLVLQKYADLEKQREAAKETCQTKSCIEAAASLLFHMDSTKNPCDDFYEFACGNFLKEVNIPEDQPAINTFNSISLEIQNKMRSKFQESVQNSDPLFSKLVKNLYASCTDTNKIDELSSEPLITLLNKLGGWPVLVGDSWPESDYNWQRSIAKFRENGVYMNFLIDLAVVKDLRNSSRYILQLDQPYFGMPDRSYLLKGHKDPLVEAYFKFMVETAVTLGANRERAVAELNETLTFEIEMAKYALPLEELRNFTKLYNKMNISQLQILAPEINWLTYINGLEFPFEIKSSEEVILINPDYVKKFANLVTTSKKRTVANYLMWRVSKSLLDLLDSRFKKLQLDYTKVMTGQATEEPRPYHCTDVMFENMDVAVGAMYIRNFFRKESREVARNMVNEVRQAFYENLDHIEWLDKETLKKAKDKAAAMTYDIAFPDELLDDNKVNSFYKNLVIHDSEYFKNILRLNRFITNFFLSRLNRPVTESEWINTATAAVVNAYYKFSDNSMQFFAAILNGAFFDPDRPKYMNFGSMGFIIAHEITHGFDDMGRQYDQHGNLENWWSKETDHRFRVKSDCIINLYGNYTLPELNRKVNGITTQGENIADVGGVKQAYKAYLNWEQKEGPELPLPGLNYTARQLFWLSNANVWCSKERLAYMDLEINTNPHSPSRFRVIGPLSNTREFAEDFNCPLGSTMNPEHKCTIW